MRVIKFRGWDANGRKGWVYGDLVHNKKVNKTEPFLTDRLMVGGYEVVPESVGQFTGFYDYDNKPIFEGDLLYSSYDSEKPFGSVRYHHDGYWFIDESLGFIIHPSNHECLGKMLEYWRWEFKVKGTTYDFRTEQKK